GRRGGRDARRTMALFEYAKWDGTQQFQPQSADVLFDQLAEYLLQYGEQVLHRLEDLVDDDEDVLEQLQQQGLLQRDGEGRWRVAPRGIRRIQEGALTELFQSFNRDAFGKHDTPQKGAGTVRLEDSRPYVYGDPLANLNLHETLKNAMIRQGGGTPLK